MDAKNLPVAAQLYIFSKLPDRDERMPEILRYLAAAGYDAVEGMYGQEPKTRERVKEVGLRYLAPHLALAQINEFAARDELIAFAQTMSARYVCVSGLPIWDQRFAPDYRAAVTLLNKYAHKFDAAGIDLLYHNHDFEFLPLGGDEGATTGMDILLGGLDVRLCLDVGWMWRAGNDPAAFLRAHRRPIVFLHLRDFKGTQSVPLGQGDVPLREILAEIPRLSGLTAIVIEQDPGSDDPLVDMRASLEWLRSAL